MKTRKAKDIRRKKGNIRIPGGWTIKIPSIEMKEGEKDAYVKYLSKSHGTPPQLAERKIQASMQKVFDRGWMIGLREMLVDRAAEYRSIFGDLEGFDPERLQGAYVPGENTGRAGKPVVRRLLVQMGRDAGRTPKQGDKDE